MATTLLLKVGFFLWAANLLIVLPVPAAAANQYVVIRSEPSLPTFSVGTVFHVNDQITVPIGTIVTLLGEDGSVNTVQGPDTLIVVADEIEPNTEVSESRTIFERLTDLLLGTASNAESLGVTRDVGEANSRKRVDPWSVSISGFGPACVLRDRIVLSRSSDLDVVSLEVVADQGMKAEGLIWAKGSSVFELPPPLATMASQMAIRAGTTQRFVHLHRLPAGIELNNVMAILAWMLDKKCETQAVEFARSLAEKLQ